MVDLSNLGPGSAAWTQQFYDAAIRNWNSKYGQATGVTVTATSIQHLPINNQMIDWTTNRPTTRFTGGNPGVANNCARNLGIAQTSWGKLHSDGGVQNTRTDDAWLGADRGAHYDLVFYIWDENTYWVGHRPDPSTGEPASYGDTEYLPHGCWEKGQALRIPIGNTTTTISSYQTAIYDDFAHTFMGLGKVGVAVAGVYNLIGYALGMDEAHAAQSGSKTIMDKCVHRKKREWNKGNCLTLGSPLTYSRGNIIRARDAYHTAPDRADDLTYSIVYHKNPTQLRNHSIGFGGGNTETYQLNAYTVEPYNAWGTGTRPTHDCYPFFSASWEIELTAYQGVMQRIHEKFHDIDSPASEGWDTWQDYDRTGHTPGGVGDRLRYSSGWSSGHPAHTYPNNRLHDDWGVIPTSNPPYYYNVPATNCNALAAWQTGPLVPLDREEYHVDITSSDQGQWNFYPAIGGGAGLTGPYLYPSDWRLSFQWY